MKKLKKSIAIALMLMATTVTGAFANDIGHIDSFSMSSNTQTYSFTYDSPVNAGHRDFETRQKAYNDQHGHIKLSDKPSKYDLRVIFKKGKGGSDIMSSSITIKDKSDTYMGITSASDAKKGQNISTRLWNASNISTAQRYVGVVNYH